MTSRWFLPSLALGLALVLAGCPDPPPPPAEEKTAETPSILAPGGGASPGEVFEAGKAAMDKEDVGTFLLLYAPKSRGHLVAEILRGALAKTFDKSMQRIPARAKELDELCARHGISDLSTKVPSGPGSRQKQLEFLIEKFKGVKDVKAFTGELNSFIEKYRKGTGHRWRGELKELKVNGDQAKARCSTFNPSTKKAGERPLKFVKVEGRWYLTF